MQSSTFIPFTSDKVHSVASLTLRIIFTRGRRTRLRNRYLFSTLACSTGQRRNSIRFETRPNCNSRRKRIPRLVDSLFLCHRAVRWYATDMAKWHRQASTGQPRYHQSRGRFGKGNRHLERRVLGPRGIEGATEVEGIARRVMGRCGHGGSGLALGPSEV